MLDKNQKRSVKRIHLVIDNVIMFLPSVYFR